MLRVLSKLLEAALGAEVRLPFVVEVSDGVGRVDSHPAHGIEDPRPAPDVDASWSRFDALTRVRVELRLADLRAEVIGLALYSLVAAACRVHLHSAHDVFSMVSSYRIPGLKSPDPDPEITMRAYAIPISRRTRRSPGARLIQRTGGADRCSSEPRHRQAGRRQDRLRSHQLRRSVARQRARDSSRPVDFVYADMEHNPLDFPGLATFLSA